MLVPDEQAISKPVCVDLLIELDTPYLEDIVPFTGSTAIFIPLTIAKASFSSFISWTADSTVLDATSTESVLISSVFIVYFSFILISISKSSVLNSSLILLTISSASSIVSTYSLVSLFNATS